MKTQGKKENQGGKGKAIQGGTEQRIFFQANFMWTRRG